MYGSFISWRDPHTPVAKEIIPQLAFDRLFRYQQGPGGFEREPERTRRLSPRCSATKPACSIWSASRRSACASQGSTDRSRAARRVLRIGALGRTAAARPRCVRRSAGSTRASSRWSVPAPAFPVQRHEHMSLMMDILVLALWSDTTRIATFMTGDAQTNEDYSFLPGVRGGFHSISHHGEEPARNVSSTRRSSPGTSSRSAYFLNRLKSLDEGGTSLLDNSMVMFGCGIKCGNRAPRGRSARSPSPAEARARSVPDARLRCCQGNAAVQSLSLHAAPHGHRGKIFRRQHRPPAGPMNSMKKTTTSILTLFAAAAALFAQEAAPPAAAPPAAGRGGRGGAPQPMPPGPNPNSQYRLGPDSLPQEGVPKGEIRGPFTLPSNVLSRHAAHLLGLCAGAVRPGGPGGAHGLSRTARRSRTRTATCARRT